MENNDKKRVLFFAEGVTLAHVVRPYTLAQSLDKSKYEVAFATSDDYKFVQVDSEITHYSIMSIGSQAFIDRVDMCQSLYSKDEIISYVNDDLKVIDDFSPDIIVGDFRLSLCISTRLRDVFYTGLINAYWSPFAKNQPLPIPEHRHINMSGLPFFKALMKFITPIVFHVQGKAINGARQHFGLSKFEHCLDGWTFADHLLFYDTPDLVPLNDDSRAQKYDFIGPVHWNPQIDHSEILATIDQDKQLVYVAMGSSGNTKVIKRIIQHVLSLSYVVIVGTSNQSLGFEKDFAGQEVYFEPLVDGNDIAKRASLVICNGGSPTAYQALAQGTPVIGIPSNMDQLLAMRFIEDAEAGKLVRFRDVNKQLFSDTIKQIVSYDELSAGAKKVQRYMSAFDAKSNFSSYLDNLA